MKHSEQIGDLAAALSLAQTKMTHAAKDSKNPHFKSTYASLASAIDACRGALNEHGIAVVQLVCSADRGHVAVESILMHSSGQWISERTTLPVVKDDPQGHGSAITYARRYGLLAIVGLAADDDDGNDASKQAKPEPAKPAAPPPVHQLLAGDSKGAFVTDASDTALTEYVRYCENMLKDKSKARNHAAAREAIEAAGAEIERRIAQAQRGARG